MWGVHSHNGRSAWLGIMWGAPSHSERSARLGIVWGTHSHSGYSARLGIVWGAPSHSGRSARLGIVWGTHSHSGRSVWLGIMWGVHSHNGCSARPESWAKYFGHWDIPPRVSPLMLCVEFVTLFCILVSSWGPPSILKLSTCHTKPRNNLPEPQNGQLQNILVFCLY